MNMTCLWTERVAMLLDNEDAEARDHVADCPSCAALIAELEEDRSQLREMPVPPLNVPAPSRRRMPVWPWAAALAASIVLAIWLWPRAEAVVPPPSVARYNPPPAVATPTAPRPVPVVARRRPPTVRTTPRLSLAAALEAALPPTVHPTATASGNVVIAMQTEDPDVVIVLLGESND